MQLPTKMSRAVDPQLHDILQKRRTISDSASPEEDGVSKHPSRGGRSRKGNNWERSRSGRRGHAPPPGRTPSAYGERACR